MDATLNGATSDSAAVQEMTPLHVHDDIGSSTLSRNGATSDSLPSSHQDPQRDGKRQTISSRSDFQNPCDGTQRRPSLHLVWWLELLASVISVICVAINVAFVSAIDAKPYESWRTSNVDITPNTVVSVVSTFSKSSLLLAVAEGISQLKWIYFQRRPHSIIDLQTFDDGSRGPLSSLRLLWSMKFRALGASAEALLTILALAIEPFAQQILSYPTEMKNAPNITVSTGAARAFDSPNIFMNPLSMTADRQTQTLTAISTAIFGSLVQSSYRC